MKVKGEITRIRSKGAWSSIDIRAKDGSTHTATGELGALELGNYIEVEGEVFNHPKYGRQIKVSLAAAPTPAKRSNGLYNYLLQYIKGAGPAIATAMIEAFGDALPDILENEPEKLTQISGISMARAVEMQLCHRQNKAFFQLVQYFGGEATQYEISRVYETLGPSCMKALEDDPYIVLKVDGFAFKKADKLARASGVGVEDKRRIAAAIFFYLKQIQKDGHCYCRLRILEKQLQQTVAKDLPIGRVADVVQEEISAGNLVLCEKEKLCLPVVANTEQACARRILALTEARQNIKVLQALVQNTLRELQSQLGYAYSPNQIESVMLPLRYRISCVTGGPGTGKTSVILGIVRVWERLTNPLQIASRTKKGIVLCAPTGRAARRMAAVTGLPAYTVDKFLHMPPPRGALIICDEASMLDIFKAAKLLQLALNGCTIVFVGDADQLSSIGPGCFFRDMTRSPRVPTIRLEISHRNPGSIAKNAARVNRGQGLNSFVHDENFRYMPADKDTVREKVIKTYMQLVDKHGIENVACVVTRRTGTSQTASDVLNGILRERLNPARPGQDTLAGCDFRAGDRVMQTENRVDLDISNGDCGTVLGVNKSTRKLAVLFEGGRRVEMTVKDSWKLVFAYAVNVHKAQGSEFEAVITAQCWEDFQFLERASLYTAMTRAKQELVLIGEETAIEAALKNTNSRNRNTRLCYLLSQRAA